LEGSDSWNGAYVYVTETGVSSPATTLSFDHGPPRPSAIPRRSRVAKAVFGSISVLLKLIKVCFLLSSRSQKKIAINTGPAVPTVSHDITNIRAVV